MSDERKEALRKRFKQTLDLVSKVSEEMGKQIERKAGKMKEEDWRMLQAACQIVKKLFPYTILPDSIRKTTIIRCNAVQDIVARAYSKNYDATTKLMNVFFETDSKFIFEIDKDILHTQIAYMFDGTNRQQTITSLHEYLLKVSIYEKLLNLLVGCIRITDEKTCDYNKIRKMGLSTKMKAIENTDNKEYLTLIEGCDVNLRNAIAHSKYILEEKDGKVRSIRFRYLLKGQDREEVISVRGFAVDKLESIRSINGSIFFSTLLEVVKNVQEKL